MGIDRILAIHEVLGACLPLGTCPHDLPASWQPQSKQDERSRHAPGGAVVRWAVDVDEGNVDDEAVMEPD